MPSAARCRCNRPVINANGDSPDYAPVCSGSKRHPDACTWEKLDEEPAEVLRGQLSLFGDPDDPVSRRGGQ